MDWRTEIVSSAEEADLFLRRQFAALSFPALTIERDKSRGLSFWAGVKAADGLSCLASFNIVSERDTVVQSVYVADRVRGNGFGLMAAKCAIGLAYERAERFVRFYQVRRDGPGFWPTLGAEPKRMPRQIGPKTELLLDRYREDVDDHSVQEIKNVIKIAAKDPLAAWRALSQTRARLKDGSFFKQAVFETLCYKQDLVLPLDQDTRAILSRRLGSLPSFGP